MSQASVQAPLRYLVPGGEKPVYIASRGGEQAQLSINADFENRRVTIRNARRLKSPARLDREGFTLISQHTKISDFYQLERYRNNYEAELTPLVLAETGANELLVFDHTLRSNSPAVRGLHLSREAASVIHNDYSDASAEQRLRDFLTASEAENRLKNRYAIVNAWRSIRDPVVQSPLALCDTRTISDQDLVTSERRAMGRIGELQLVSWNPEHQWYYYPLMNRDEVLLIKTFDSARDGRARRSIHTAFIDPSAPEEAPPRESIESRILVFY
jgi:hypothetical protein